jgi:hypothetical protein
LDDEFKALKQEHLRVLQQINQKTVTWILSRTHSTPYETMPRTNVVSRRLWDYGDTYGRQIEDTIQCIRGVHLGFRFEGYGCRRRNSIAYMEVNNTYALNGQRPDWLLAHSLLLIVLFSLANGGATPGPPTSSTGSAVQLFLREWLVSTLKCRNEVYGLVEDSHKGNQIGHSPNYCWYRV